ncbi:hypothetical protein MNBD_GAMMA05-1018 [hydrothermal vent metagenome]|uniref:Iron-binding zinc finger CDGSH type domain-containing protein n=1 Tax=hydrothermal vent metagenome TaxID=652676 RepID=A0A3B0X5F9_9ZZZZ
MSENEKTTISPAPDGPLMVNELSNLSNQNGAVKTEETIALCRCGKSANKPFCDGAHVKVGFVSENQEKGLSDQCDNYVGKNITIHDNRRLCAHAGVCTNNLAAVFRMKQEPWINADAAETAEIIAVIQKCPSGALSFTVDAKKNVVEYSAAAIFIAPNGPYVVKGCPELNSVSWGEGALQQQYALCRCGASKNKPFCDGSHWSVEFVDEKN